MIRALVLLEVPGQPERQTYNKLQKRLACPGDDVGRRGQESRVRTGDVTGNRQDVQHVSAAGGKQGVHRSRIGKCVPSGKQLRKLQDNQGGGQVGAGGVGEGLMMTGLRHPLKCFPFLLNVKEHA